MVNSSPIFKHSSQPFGVLGVTLPTISDRKPLLVTTRPSWLVDKLGSSADHVPKLEREILKGEMNMKCSEFTLSVAKKSSKK